MERRSREAERAVLAYIECREVMETYTQAFWSEMERSEIWEEKEKNVGKPRVS